MHYIIKSLHAKGVDVEIVKNGARILCHIKGAGKCKSEKMTPSMARLRGAVKSVTITVVKDVKVNKPPVAKKKSVIEEVKEINVLLNKVEESKIPTREQFIEKTVNENTKQYLFDRATEYFCLDVKSKMNKDEIASMMYDEIVKSTKKAQE